MKKNKSTNKCLFKKSALALSVLVVCGQTHAAPLPQQTYDDAASSMLNRPEFIGGCFV